MYLKNFRFQVALRIFLLTVTIAGFFYLLQNTRLYMTIVLAGLVILFQVFGLVRYVEKTNQAMNRFLVAIQHGDFAQSFSQKELGSSFSRLVDSLNEVMAQFQKARSEKEAQYRYLQTIIHHVGTGLITFRSDGTVDLVNTAAKRLLKVTHLKNIRSLGSFSPPLVEKLFTIKPGEKALVKIDTLDIELVIRGAEFTMKGQKFTLVSLQNIQSELEEKELEAWQRLIRVLTHEIMNSMTPITSMTATILDLLTPGKAGDLSQDNLEDIREAVQTIHKRSRGLGEFVDAYRNLTLIPKPNFKIFPIEELFTRVEKLLENKLKENNIILSRLVDPHSLELTADPGLMEQVIINLVLNAVDALHSQADPVIELKAFLGDDGRLTIQVEDNGDGIAPEALEKVFIPFFTTKKKGSGIGLSLSRQILKFHNATITCQSRINRGARFTIRF